MINKKLKRTRRAKSTKSRIKKIGGNRLLIHRTPKHIYAQLLDQNNNVLTASSTLEAEVKKQIKNGGNLEAAKVVGKDVATKIKKLGLDKHHLSFDRNGFKYHGRVAALATSAREVGLKF